MTHGIELRHLRHFVALAEERHFGRAARRCHITQPPFSVSIRQLEQRLGFALVERTPSEMRLTPAGAAYYEEAAKVLQQLGHAQDLATRVNGGLQGLLRVGFFASMLYRGLDRAVRRFEAQHPDVGLQLVEASTADQIPALLRGTIQYGFVHSSALPATFASQELLREPFVLCVPQALESPAGRTRLAAWREQPFVLFSRAWSPAYYDQVVSRCVAAGFHPTIQHEARHWLTVIACVAKGMGVTLVPRSLKKGRFAGVRFVDIEPSAVESVVRGAWLSRDSNDAVLAAWHATVRREVKG